MNKVIKEIKRFIGNSADKIMAIEKIRDILFALSPLNKQPIDRVKWVPLDTIQSNDYNPNFVAKTEMKLLLRSIEHDNYTQPIVVIFDSMQDKYIIVDGFHRYFVMKTNKEIFNRTGGLLPIAIINKEINDRMASTIRHNRARGKHLIQGMSSMVFNMLEHGWDDAAICNELGMEPEEILKLKHITGFSKLFKDHEYQKSWQTNRQLLLKKQREKEI